MSKKFFRGFHESTVVNVPEARVVVYEFFGRSTDIQCGNEAYLVEKLPGTSTGAHFHDVDQFQVFFPARGATYQRRSISSITVHYTDAFRTYGPFASGPTDRLYFYTLRARPSTLHADMPASRSLRRHRGVRTRMAELKRLDVPVGIESLIAREPDGLSASVVRIGPNADIRLPAVDQIAGRYYCVLDGALMTERGALGARSLGWVGAPSEEMVLAATGEGCCLLVLDFPCPPTSDRSSTGRAAESLPSPIEDERGAAPTAVRAGLNAGSPGEEAGRGG